MNSTGDARRASAGQWLAAVCCVAAGALAQTACLQSVLQSETTAGTVVSSGLWQRLVARLGGEIFAGDAGELLAQVPFLPLATIVGAAALACWLLGAVLIARRLHASWSYALMEWGRRGWLWWLLPGLWEGARVGTLVLGWDGGAAVVLGSFVVWQGLTWAGWLATGFALAAVSATSKPETPALARGRGWNSAGWVGLACSVYVVVFTAMNWQLYFGLLLPHGDSAMYEEHLWNLTHGKGFRSYLDQGLFLGEHIQFVHVFLLPAYLIWPSHLLLELCESLALASGAIFVYRIARRHTDSAGMGVALACGYLLYFPMQFLDIAIDLKTFRPMAFGVPLLLWALDALERGRYRQMTVLLLLTLTAKEDYAIVLAPLGLWIAVRQPRWMKSTTPEVTEGRGGDEKSAESPSGRVRAGGIALAVGAAGYLILATRVLIPWFRGGEEVHYARYFSRFGGSMEEIVLNMLGDPVGLAEALLTPATVIYALSMLGPLAFLPLGSPGRLAVAAPLFGILCLNEIARDPRHHFHAPLVPIVFWACAAGMGQLLRWWKRRARAGVFDGSRFVRHLAWTAPLATGLFVSLAPLGLAFWDPDSQAYWRTLYVPGQRAELFERVYEQIPQTARVASTDFVHPRFTHHERSYDYSEYARRVSGDTTRVPADTEYIVIDTRHKYSKITQPADVRELRDEPERWELLPDVTDGHFIVLKRKTP